MALVLLLTACHGDTPNPPEWQHTEKRNHPNTGKIFDLKTQTELSPKQLIEALKNSRWVLIGEQHDNLDHHRLEQWLLETLSALRPQGSLLLEMITPEQQAAVRDTQLAFAQHRPPKETDLPAALSWQKGWDWSLYGTLMRYSLQQNYPILSANLSAQELQSIYRTQPSLPAGLATRPQVIQQLDALIKESHCNLLPESQIPAMRAVQQQRDRRMAETLSKAPQPAVLLAGSQHVRKDLGVPLHWADMGIQEGLKVLILAEAQDSLPSQEADFIWFTPSPAPQDHCAGITFKRP